MVENHHFLLLLFYRWLGVMFYSHVKPEKEGRKKTTGKEKYQTLFSLFFSNRAGRSCWVVRFCCFSFQSVVARGTHTPTRSMSSSFLCVLDGCYLGFLFSYAQKNLMTRLVVSVATHITAHLRLHTTHTDKETIKITLGRTRILKMPVSSARNSFLPFFFLRWWFSPILPNGSFFLVVWWINFYFFIGWEVIGRRYVSIRFIYTIGSYRYE